MNNDISLESLVFDDAGVTLTCQDVIMIAREVGSEERSVMDMLSHNKLLYPICTKITNL